MESFKINEREALVEIQEHHKDKIWSQDQFDEIEEEFTGVSCPKPDCNGDDLLYSPIQDGVGIGKVGYAYQWIETLYCEDCESTFIFIEDLEKVEA